MVLHVCRVAFVLLESFICWGEHRQLAQLQVGQGYWIFLDKVVELKLDIRREISLICIMQQVGSENLFYEIVLHLITYQTISTKFY